ncbi:MAG: hypothetical protein AVDCRST_MAG19-2489, partial [uncultured Thermomicrobiales bacterium]
ERASEGDAVRRYRRARSGILDGRHPVGGACHRRV